MWRQLLDRLWSSFFIIDETLAQLQALVTDCIQQLSPEFPDPLLILEGAKVGLEEQEARADGNEAVLGFLVPEEARLCVEATVLQCVEDPAECLGGGERLSAARGGTDRPDGLEGVETGCFKEAQRVEEQRSIIANLKIIS